MALSKELTAELLGLLINGSQSKDEDKDDKKTTPTEEELRAQIEADLRAKAEAEEAKRKAEEAKKKTGNKDENDDVVESTEKLTPIEKRLLEKEIESGLRDSGLEWDSATEFLEKFVNFDQFRSENEDDVFDADKIEEFVSAISSVATGTPPQSKKKPAGKPGFGRYLDKED